jgi:hypothetical protein
VNVGTARRNDERPSETCMVLRRWVAGWLDHDLFVAYSQKRHSGELETLRTRQSRLPKYLRQENKLHHSSTL